MVNVFLLPSPSSSPGSIILLPPLKKNLKQTNKVYPESVAQISSQAHESTASAYRKTGITRVISMETDQKQDIHDRSSVGQIIRPDDPDLGI